MRNMKIFVLIVCCIQVSFAAPQFITFKDGKIGVNFGGYHASAGLGGLITGNPADGGLSASAGTPFGQNAAAGLDGRINGRTSGILYAGAEANPQVGASAVLGGTVGEGGFAGSESHAFSKQSSNTKTLTVLNEETEGHAHDKPQDSDNVIQKVKPSKKHSLIQLDEAAKIRLPKSNLVEGTHKEAPIYATSEPTQSIASSTFKRNLNAYEAAKVVVAKKQKENRRHYLNQRRRENNLNKTDEPLPLQKYYMQNLLSGNSDVSNRVNTKQVRNANRKASTVLVAAEDGRVSGAGSGVPTTANKQLSVDTGSIINSALSIPIGILQSLQNSFAGFRFNKEARANYNQQ